jgi:SAM-dependent methyltransferase
LAGAAEERVLPGGDPSLFAWHLARYEFAIPFVRGKRVLDVGSGEGYGTARLAEVASEVIGVDYSPQIVAHAATTYRRPNLAFRVGDAAALEPTLGPVDVVTCFEVLEHIEAQDAVLGGIAQLLSPGGVLILSTPNRLVDAPFDRFADNPYHIAVRSPRELRRVVGRHFARLTLYGQTPRGNWLHVALKALDVFNLRHRLVRSARTQRRLATTVMGQRWHPDEIDFRFSRLLVRQSPITLVVASRSRSGRL